MSVPSRRNSKMDCGMGATQNLVFKDKQETFTFSDYGPVDLCFLFDYCTIILLLNTFTQASWVP